MQYTYFVPRNTTKLTTRGGTSPDGDSHPGEEIYTPSGDEAKGTRLHKGCLRVTDFLSSQTVMSANV